MCRPVGTSGITYTTSTYSPSIALFTTTTICPTSCSSPNIYKSPQHPGSRPHTPPHTSTVLSKTHPPTPFFYIYISLLPPIYLILYILPTIYYYYLSLFLIIILSPSLYHIYLSIYINFIIIMKSIVANSCVLTYSR